jgi:hypothetical protein
MKTIKKILIVGLVVLASIIWGGGAAFADIRFAFWGDAVFNPVYVVNSPKNAEDYLYGGPDAATYTGVALGPDWGGYGPRLQFGAYGSDPEERYGFNLEIHADFWWAQVLDNNTSLGSYYNQGDKNTTYWLNKSTSNNGVVVGDNANLWIKPFDFLTLKVGKYTEDVLRSKISHAADFPNLVALGPSWRYGDKLLFLFDGDEDTIFTRFMANRGAHIAVEFGALYVGASIGDSNQSDPQKDGLVDAFSQIQIGAGYTIENLGFARLQFLGGTKKWDNGLTDKAASGLATLTEYSRIEAAFALTSLPVGTVDIGVKIPLGYKTGEVNGKDEKTQAPFSASVGSTLLLGPIDLLARIDTTFAGRTEVDGKTADEDPFTFVIAAEPSYKIGESGISVGADVEFVLAGNSKSLSGTDLKENTDGSSLLGLGLWVGKAIGAASLRVGVLAQLPVAHNWDGDETRSTMIAIPIQFSFSL